eukprot:5283772-Prymnesium_polylepis.1
MSDRHAWIGAFHACAARDVCEGSVPTTDVSPPRVDVRSERVLMVVARVRRLCCVLRLERRADARDERCSFCASASKRDARI